MKRHRLQAVPLERAKEIFFDALTAAGFFKASEEEIETQAALGRATSRAVYAQRDVPHYPSAAMDGIAVRSERTRQASSQTPLRLAQRSDFEYVDTGNPVPERFDAVIKIEDVREIDAETVEITKPVSVGKHIRAVGEDFARGSQIVSANCRITPEVIAALLSTGNLRVWVKRRCNAIFIPTGSELVPPHQEPLVGQVVEANSQIVKGSIERWGGAVTVHPIVPNDSDCIRCAVKEALAQHDLILIGAGTSKGRVDLVPEIVKEFGEVLVHGVAYHPGHPVLLGIFPPSSVEKGAGVRAIIGLPGYPVAAWLALHLFVRPLLERYYDGRERELFTVQAKLTKPIRSVGGYREFVRAQIERAADGSHLVHPLQGGASKLSTIVGAEWWIEISEGTESVPEGARVEVTLIY